MQQIESWSDPNATLTENANSFKQIIDDTHWL